MTSPCHDPEGGVAGDAGDARGRLFEAGGRRGPLRTAYGLMV